jgi:hypothetical protein
VIDAPRAHLLAHAREGHELHLRLLGALVAHLGDAPRSQGEEAVQPVREQRRVRAHGRERHDLVRCVAGLLEQLARGGLGGRLAGIDEATRRLERDLARAVAILAHHHDLALGRHGDHVHPIG